MPPWADVASGADADEPAARLALSRTVAELHAHGWCLGTSGNMSVTLAHRPRRLLITPSGHDKRRLDPADLLIVDGDGEPVGQGRPSAETLIHCAIAAAQGAGSTLHTHSVAATNLSTHFLAAGGFVLSGYEMLKGLAGIETHETEVFVPILPNAQNMRRFSREVESLFADRPDTRCFLIAGHGLYTWGETLRDAQRHVEVLEFLFECVARRPPFGRLG